MPRAAPLVCGKITASGGSSSPLGNIEGIHAMFAQLFDAADYSRRSWYLFLSTMMRDFFISAGLSSLSGRMRIVWTSSMLKPASRRSMAVSPRTHSSIRSFILSGFYLFEEMDFFILNKLAGVGNAGVDVLDGYLRKISFACNLFGPYSGREQIQYLRYHDAVAFNAWPAVAYLVIDRDSFKIVFHFIASLPQNHNIFFILCQAAVSSPLRPNAHKAAGHDEFGAALKRLIGDFIAGDKVVSSLVTRPCLNKKASSMKKVKKGASQGGKVSVPGFFREARKALEMLGEGSAYRGYAIR